MATAHFSLCERVLHHGGGDYVLVRLPYVVTEGEEYPRSYEVLVKEFLGPSADAGRVLEMVVDPRRRPPFSIERLQEIAFDFYRSMARTMKSGIVPDIKGRSSTA